jgi:hypothetical protein
VEVTKLVALGLGVHTRSFYKIESSSKGEQQLRGLGNRDEIKTLVDIAE